MTSVSSDATQTDSTKWLILSAITISGLLVLAAYIIYSKTTHRKTWLILGLSNAGKTALFYRLKESKFVETVTSASENEMDLLTKHNIIDVPGHDKLRFRFAEFLPITKGVIFVIDATQATRSIRAIAEYFYQILINKHVQKRNIPILVLCNKYDLLLATDKLKIMTAMENEIERIRRTQAAGVLAQGEEEVPFIGYENEIFTFEQLENEIIFSEISVKEDDVEGDEHLEDTREAVFSFLK